MSDRRILHETVGLPMENILKEGYNAVPHQIVATPPPPPPANSGNENEGGGNQGGGCQDK